MEKRTVLSFRKMDNEVCHVVAQHVVMTESADNIKHNCTRLYLTDGRNIVVSGSEADTLQVLGLALEVA